VSTLKERISSFFSRLGGQRDASSPDAHRNLDKRLVLQFSDKKIPTAKQFKHLPRFLNAEERLTIRILGVIGLVALVAIGTKLAQEHLTAVPAAGGDYVEASVGTPQFINPILTSTNDADLDIIKLVFSGLMKTTSKGELVPDLASAYTVSDDGKTYTFTLRNGVTWHDGQPFTSKDVAATMALIENPDAKSTLAAQFKNVTVTTPDAHTVVFTLSVPFAPFLSMLTVGILPAHLWQDVKPGNVSRAELNIKPIGTGPFKFKSFTEDKNGAILSYTLVRNDNYYEKSAYLSSITFKYYADFGAAHDALAARKVDGMSFLPLQFRSDVEKQQNVRFYTLRLPQYTAIFFNQTKNPALASKNVRQALDTAIDRETLLSQAVGDNGVLVWSPILAGYVGFNPDVKKYPFDQAAAAALLDKDGWTLDPADGIRKQQTKNGKNVVTTPLSITLTTADAQENIAVAQRIKTDWEAIGVQTSLEIVPSSRIEQDKISPRDYDALLYGEIIGTDPDPYPFWHSSQDTASGLNLANYSNPRVDQILEQARAATKTSDRVTLYGQFQDILADEVPAVLLYSPTYTYVVGRKIQGIEAGTIFTPADRFDDITSWYENTRYVWK
jgi:peptide/nickel transport system substrate-binding protein